MSEHDEVSLGDQIPTVRVLPVPQVVSYNFARARHEAGWAQVETSEHLEPFLGYRLGQVGGSAIERTFHTDRPRKMSCAQVAAFARCFNRPVGWFFLPPDGRAGNILVQPNTDAAPAGITAAALTTIAIGPTGWESRSVRLGESLVSDCATVETALADALNGAGDRYDWDALLDRRRFAISARVLDRLTGPDTDEYLTDLAALLVELAHPSPRARSSPAAGSLVSGRRRRWHIALLAVAVAAAVASAWVISKFTDLPPGGSAPPQRASPAKDRRALSELVVADRHRRGYRRELSGDGWATHGRSSVRQHVLADEMIDGSPMAECGGDCLSSKSVHAGPRRPARYVSRLAIRTTKGPSPGSSTA